MSLPDSGERVFMAPGRRVPKNFLRILWLFVDFEASVIIDFKQRKICFRDIMLPNKFLTLWPESQIDVGFNEITKLSDDELDGKKVFTVTTKRGKAALLHSRFEEIKELHDLISSIFEEHK